MTLSQSDVWCHAGSPAVSREETDFMIDVKVNLEGYHKITAAMLFEILKILLPFLIYFLVQLVKIGNYLPFHNKEKNVSH